jgi:hypothetical protein
MPEKCFSLQPKTAKQSVHLTDVALMLSGEEDIEICKELAGNRWGASGFVTPVKPNAGQSLAMTVAPSVSSGNNVSLM